MRCLMRASAILILASRIFFALCRSFHEKKPRGLCRFKNNFVPLRRLHAEAPICGPPWVGMHIGKKAFTRRFVHWHIETSQLSNLFTVNGKATADAHQKNVFDTHFVPIRLVSPPAAGNCRWHDDIFGVGDSALLDHTVKGNAKASMCGTSDKK